MRLNQFLEKLAQTPRIWYVDQSLQCIRCRDVTDKQIHCPISMVGLQMTGLRGYASQFPIKVGQSIGLSSPLIWRILSASDHHTVDGQLRYPTLRRRLIRACGLAQTGVR